jgi:signal transduction histidine kinase
MDLAKPRPPRAEAVDVAALAREVVALAARAERSSDVGVEYVGPDGAAIARCDGAQMRQVLWNLVRNAVQASAPNTKVAVRVEPRGKKLFLTVDDHGPGISDEDRARIFEAFYTTRSHGAGIGLAVVKRIIDDHAAMGAKISIRAGTGGGASFQVTLSTEVAGLRTSLAPAAGA